MVSLNAKRKSREDDASHDIRTPTGSPPSKKLRITRSQKQALIDNLQLEITERARKLRAQYALQTNDLRARIERRINRIPIALRNANMGELWEKHQAALRAQQEGTSPKKLLSPGKAPRNVAAMKSPGKQRALTASPGARRIRKQSHEGGIYSDKENAPTTGESLDVLKNPKRRGKPGAAGGASRVVSQEVRGTDYRILSPKSNNSRTYPQSPLRASPEKPQNASYLSRPMSPLKPSSPLKSTSASMPGPPSGARARATRGVPSTTSSRPPSQAARPGSRAGATSRMIRSPLSRPATRQLERRGSVSSTSSTATVAKPTKTGTGARKATAASAVNSSAKKTTVARNQGALAASKRNTASTTRKATTSTTADAPATKQRALRKRA
ncbi:hypothetical protein BDW42DRAFT_180765 [Aspergillus taichungensis]|uniref:Borealin N-terminal domain-containing protein n=1 Tax=Aspergillus taichungensis TaxID=482145 RepID=A0A2J5HEU6_9EURO|nr:hypothetical protein BDW42DRAFT_180765 [Aspergillus taichungensis]